jgi:hypothetical protein
MKRPILVTEKLLKKIERLKRQLKEAKILLQLSQAMDEMEKTYAALPAGQLSRPGDPPLSHKRLAKKKKASTAKKSKSIKKPAKKRLKSAK